MRQMKAAYLLGLWRARFLDGLGLGSCLGLLGSCWLLGHLGLGSLLCCRLCRGLCHLLGRLGSCRRGCSRLGVGSRCGHGCKHIIRSASDFAAFGGKALSVWLQAALGGTWQKALRQLPALLPSRCIHDRTCALQITQSGSMHMYALGRLGKVGFCFQTRIELQIRNFGSCSRSLLPYRQTVRQACHKTSAEQHACDGGQAMASMTCSTRQELCPPAVLGAAGFLAAGAFFGAFLGVFALAVFGFVACRARRQASATNAHAYCGVP